MVTGVGASALFPQIPKIFFYPQQKCCPHCGCKLKVLKTREKIVVTLDIGSFLAKETVLHCPNDQLVFCSDQLRTLAPYKGIFGYDVIVYVGKALFIHCRNNQEIMKNLAAQNITISEREISYLGRKFIIYLALAHRESRNRLKQAMVNRGGYILHVDGTCEGGSPNLFCGLDGISELVLDNIKIPSEKKELLVPFFRRIKNDYGDPAALVHDMGKGIMSAVAEVFPGRPDYICHFHFLRDVGKDLLLQNYQIIIQRLRTLNIRAMLRKKARYIEQKIGRHCTVITDLRKSIESNKLETTNIECIPDAATCSLIYWAFESLQNSGGYGFPFDRPHLDFYLRLKEIHHWLGNIKGIRLRQEANDNNYLVKVWKLLEKVMEDKKLIEAVNNLQIDAEVFDELRKAMRIAPPNGKNGLNDDGDDMDIKSIENDMHRFKQWLINDEERKEKYVKMLNQMDKYWDKLFANSMVMDTPEGPIMIIPQRTNNILERFFRGEKRRGRKKSGTASLSKFLKTILADTPFVRNLENDEYVTIILNGCDNLEHRFSQIDAKLVFEQMKKEQTSLDKMPKEIKKMVCKSNLPEMISALFGTASNNGANRHLRS